MPRTTAAKTGMPAREYGQEKPAQPQSRGDSAQNQPQRARPSGEGGGDKRGSRQAKVHRKAVCVVERAATRSSPVMKCCFIAHRPSKATAQPSAAAEASTRAFART